MIGGQRFRIEPPAFLPTIQRFEDQKSHPLRRSPENKSQLQNRWKLACVLAAAIWPLPLSRRKP